VHEIHVDVLRSITALPTEVVWDHECSLALVLCLHEDCITRILKKIKAKSLKRRNSETVVNWTDVYLHFLPHITSSTAS
jgi:transcription elongation factor GreA-like protein